MSDIRAETGNLSFSSMASLSVSEGSRMDYAVFFLSGKQRYAVCIMEAKYDYTIHATAQVCILCPFESLTA